MLVIMIIPDNYNTDTGGCQGGAVGSAVDRVDGFQSEGHVLESQL